MQIQIWEKYSLSVVCDHKDYLQLLCTWIWLWWSLTLVTAGLRFCEVLHLGVKQSSAQYWTQQPAVSKAEIIRNMKPPSALLCFLSEYFNACVLFFLSFTHEYGP